MSYETFLAQKAITAVPTGFKCGELSTKLFPFQRDVVKWSCKRGRSALFEDCGLGKTIQQLTWAEEVAKKTDGEVLILAPLCVSGQTVAEGEKFGIEVTHAQSQADIQPGINITNYEKLHRFETEKFRGVVLDESSILKSYDGSTRTQIIESFNVTPYKLACTATPAPNDFMELGNHAEFLGVMSRVEMLATFFVHDGGETAKWRLKGHAESEFWRWLCSWAVNIRMPSDLGYENGAFKLPELKIIEHIVEAGQAMDGFLFPMQASTLDERRAARRSSLRERAGLAADLANSNKDQWLIWCNLNSESQELAKSINGAVEICGSTPLDEREEAMSGFTDGSVRCLVSKPSISGWGMNWQHCQNMAFVGLSDSYEEFYQAVRRCWRFGQKKSVNAHIITSSSEGAVLANIKRKEADSRRMADEMVKHMADISSSEIKGVKRQTIEYNPTMPMALPCWLQ